ncbi:TsaC protein (YrdC domain) required for threonylcarbamoyladenosine t(6)A37 modification in tRNA [Fimbriiglobus ruber]|uniref:TsaC protein (YrdC domain) required for threonylcarbamoyladenosine t(6)A37 modification in tRNA n=1 Tax=Fimbriiglobus ruber TaxID=1908690 RepID=A0A225DQF8_9BACT|nr:TsaC protein (YrdC domain) required for threonylcarbamoyladenosine t(6)A37 modification in tRNA [Fimbriiglobus ruber]
MSFTQQGDGPVFSAAEPGHWDVKIRERGWILREDNIYKLWYTGYDGTATGRRMLGYATSPDGVRWTRHPGNPLVPDHWVEDVMVVKDGSRYVMFAEGENDLAQLLTSPDGIKWDRVGRLDVRQADGRPIPDGPYGTPTAFRDGSRWLLFYEREDKGVWLAASDDLKVWRNVRDEPVLSPGPGDYDRDMIALNQVIKHGGRYYAYYHGCATTGPDARKWSVGVAVSDDFLHWEKYPGNPLLPVAENKSSGILVDTGEGFRLYTVHPAVYLHTPRGR